MKKYLFLAIILCIIISACRPGTGPTPASLSIQPVLSTPTPVSSAPSGSIVGEPEVVYRWHSDRCANDMLPNLPTRAIRNADGTVQLIISSSTIYRLIGADFDSLEPDCSPIMVSDEDRDPANYDHSEWLAALYTEDGRTIHAIVHNEYHGDQAGSIWQAALDFSPEQGTQKWTYQA